MLRMFGRILKIGVVTEPPAPSRDSDTAAFEADGEALKVMVDRRFRGSIAIRQVDAGSCNGCELEIQALGNPYYSIERFGVHFVASPRHADILLVTGPVSRHMEAALGRTWSATPQPRWVIAAGDCASCGGEFGTSYASCGAVDKVIPVDLKIPGCPPTPGQLVAGILLLLRMRA